ncbi:MAG TPA: NADH-quinone oxidoreductase subunit N [Myxococcota bacterium]|jgi:NADH-quinone oxidoreductase subunit N|nr:NADH-quinone oxidoreductase subunit N [Myxococcota bacterium]
MNGLPQVNVQAVVPTLYPAVGAMAVLVVEVLLAGRATFLGRPLTKGRVANYLGVLSAVALGLSVIAAAQSLVAGDSIPFDPESPMFRLDRFSSFAILVLGVGSMLGCLLSVNYLLELGISHGEYYCLLLAATTGMMFMVGAVDLLLVFVGLELMSIPIYVLAGFQRRNLRSNESALKYFLVGSFASAVLLYGMTLVYGATGSLDYATIRGAIDPTSPLALAGIALVIVGFAFKVSAVPFHQWTPDVYEGAPTAVTAYMSVTVKTAAFVALLRFLTEAVGPPASAVANLPGLFAALAVLTFVVGNVMAVIQSNVKRMLAYSSIAHGGYLLLGFVATTAEGYAAMLFYLLVYVFMNVGAFGVIVALANQGRDTDRFDDFAGLARTRPGLAALMTLFMVSLAGIPGTAGFMAKFGLFSAVVRAQHVGLAVLAVLASLISVYYYLRLPVLMYMREPAGEAPRAETDALEGIVLVICAIAVLVLGFFPNLGIFLGELRLLDLARASVASLF